MAKIDLSKLAGGAVQERFDTELQKVIDNIIDPNTSHKKKRKLQLTITFETDESRQIALAEIETKLTLAPAEAVPTKFLLDRDVKGKGVAAEFTQGRLFENADVEPETVDNSKVSYMDKKQAGKA